MNRWPLNDTIAVLLLSVVMLSPLPLGSNRPLFWLISAIFVFVTVAIFLVWTAMIQKKMPIPFGKYGLLFAVVLGLQLYILMQVTGIMPNLESIAPKASLLSFIRILSYAAFFFLAIQVSQNTTRANWMLHGIFFSSVGYALFGFAEVTNFVDYPHFLGKQQYIGDATGTFINRNSYATYLGFGILSGMSLIKQRINRTGAGFCLSFFADIRLASYLVLSVLMVTTLVLTNSRMGVVAFLVAATIFIFRSTAMQNNLKIPTRVIVVATFFLAIPGVQFLYGNGLFERLGSVEKDIDVRFSLYSQVWEMVRSKPLTGQGADSFAVAFPAFHRLPVSPDLVWDKAHNTYLTNWAELGMIFGSIPLLLGMIVFVKMCKYVFFRRQDTVLPLLGVCVAVQAGLHSLVDFSLEIQANVYVFLAIMALGFSAAVRSELDDVWRARHDAD
ncbi:MAG: O-antigen ligase family protein [Rhodobacteraceae bacterium]|nr:O-antigen ligase family protein [Paracoccaceae bacterium]